MALVVKNPAVSAGDIRDLGSIPESGRSPGVGNSNPLQYSCLGSPMDRGAWRATWGHKELEATEHIYRRICIFTMLDFSKIL